MHVDYRTVFQTEYGCLGRKIAEFERAEDAQEYVQLQNARYVPGQWFCGKCNFRLSGNILDAQAGRADVNPKTPEPCPNDNEEMKPISWKMYAEDLEGYIRTERDRYRLLCDQSLSVIREYAPGFEVLIKSLEEATQS
jgi:hypothetical protein